FLVIIFGILLGNYGLSGRLALLQIIPNLIVVVLFTRLATQRDLKSSYTISIGMAVLSIATMVGILWFSEDTTQIFVNGGLASILFIIGFIGMRVGTAYPTSIVLTMSADISDYETAR